FHVTGVQTCALPIFPMHVVGVRVDARVGPPLAALHVPRTTVPDDPLDTQPVRVLHQPLRGGVAAGGVDHQVPGAALTVNGPDTGTAAHVPVRVDPAAAATELADQQRHQRLRTRGGATGIT